jgi:twinfilin-like protein
MLARDWQGLDLASEVVVLVSSGNQHVDDIPAAVSTEVPRYHVYNFKHNHEGDALESVVFVYTCPGFKCSVKAGSSEVAA